MTRTDDGTKTAVSNRRALHDYAVEERFEAGVELVGTEVKSLRLGRASLADAYGIVRGRELFLVGATIEQYDQGNRANHQPGRDRRLLMHGREIERVRQRTQERGLTLVALRIYFRAGRAKVELGLARGKNTVDRRDTLAERDAKREIERAVKLGERE